MIPPIIKVELQKEEKEPEEDTCSSGWFSSRKIGAIAWRLRESIPSAGAVVRQTLDGIADVIAISAATIALEFNEMEREARQQVEEHHLGGGSCTNLGSSAADDLKEITTEEHNKQSMEHFVQSCNKAFSKLPWEIWRNDATADGIRCEQDGLSSASSIRGSFIDDCELKESILALSLDEKTFTEPFLDNDALVIENSMQFGGDLEYDAQYCYFEQKKRISETQFLEENRSSINRLLQVDLNLWKMHEELVGSTALLSEGAFWKNYFFHCERLRITIENERSTQGNDRSLPDVNKVVEAKSNYISTKEHSDASTTLTSKTLNCTDDEFEDAVFVNKRDALPPFIQKYPQTLSNGSIVLIGSDGGDLEKYASHPAL